MILFIFSLSAYYIVSTTQTNKRTDYSGKNISELVNKEWENFTKSDKTIIYKKIDVIGWDEWFAGNLSYHLGGNIRHKVYMENFVDAVAFRKNQERNFILIGKSEKIFEVCSLSGLKDYVIHKVEIADHRVCFLLLKSDIK